MRDVNGVVAEVTGDSGADYDDGGAIGGIHECKIIESVLSVVVMCL